MFYLNKYNKILFFFFLLIKYPFFFFKIINKYFFNLIRIIYLNNRIYNTIYFIFILFNLNKLIFFIFLKKMNKNKIYYNYISNYYNNSQHNSYFLMNEIENNSLFSEKYYFSIYLMNTFSNFIFNISFFINHTIETHPFFFYKLISLLFLDHNVQIKQFIELFGIDFPNKQKRFLLYYQFNSFLFNSRFFFKFYTNEFDWICSISNLFSNIIWYERELFDLFGIHFSNNNDLRRILTDYGFKGYPLRKDFPLIGFVEINFNEEIQKLIYLPVQLTQSYRIFDTFCPWSIFYKKIYSNYLIK